MKKLIGHIGVDAGLCWIGDPCYVMGDDASRRVHDWGDFCKKLHNHPSQYSAPLGEGTGLAVNTGYGDGSYPVYIEIEECGNWGDRVKSITVEFLEDEVEEGY